MEENTEQILAKKYVNKHIEPISSENTINPLLRNPDSTFLNAFLAGPQVTTRFFTLNGESSPLNRQQLLTTVFERTKKEMEDKGIDALGIAGRLVGIKIGLGMRLEGSKEYPVQAIKSFNIRGDRGEINLASLLPSDYQVVWVPGGHVERSAHDYINKLVIIAGDITSPECLLVALHEIGHYVDLASDSERRMKLAEIQKNMMVPSFEELKKIYPAVAQAFLAQFNPVTDHDVKIFMESERNAWAFALKTISKVTANTNLLRACREYIHKYPLWIQAQMLRSRNFVS